MVAMLLAVTIAGGAQTAPAIASHPFTGHWTADLTRSTLHPGPPIKSTTLDFAVTSETVTITDRVVTASGRERSSGATTFRTDGEEHPHDELMPGLIVTARWRDSHVLETVLRRRDGHVDRVTYELSSDGATLTTRTSGDLGDQVIVFERQE